MKHSKDIFQQNEFTNKLIDFEIQKSFRNRKYELSKSKSSEGFEESDTYLFDQANKVMDDLNDEYITGIEKFEKNWSNIKSPTKVEEKKLTTTFNPFKNTPADDKKEEKKPSVTFVIGKDKRKSGGAGQINIPLVTDLSKNLK